MLQPLELYLFVAYRKTRSATQRYKRYWVTKEKVDKFVERMRVSMVDIKRSDGDENAGKRFVSRYDDKSTVMCMHEDGSVGVVNHPSSTIDYKAMKREEEQTIDSFQVWRNDITCVNSYEGVHLRNKEGDVISEGEAVFKDFKKLPVYNIKQLYSTYGRNFRISKKGLLMIISDKSEFRVLPLEWIFLKHSEKNKIMEIRSEKSMEKLKEFYYDEYDSIVYLLSIDGKVYRRKIVYCYNQTKGILKLDMVKINNRKGRDPSISLTDTAESKEESSGLSHPEKKYSCIIKLKLQHMLAVSSMKSDESFISLIMMRGDRLVVVSERHITSESCIDITNDAKIDRKEERHPIHMMSSIVCSGIEMIVSCMVFHHINIHIVQNNTLHPVVEYYSYCANYFNNMIDIDNTLYIAGSDFLKKVQVSYD